jgi:D-glycero-D-manno-heptose 1,7-bisphosphate phosphatase
VRPRNAIFLDRDGVLTNNRDHYYIWKQDQLQFVDGVFGNLQLLAQHGFLLFIVSNQGGISKNLYRREDTQNLHKQIDKCLKDNHIEVQEIVFCPHHPDYEKCFCRKPDSLMIDKLIAKYNLSKTGSYMIGDSKSDMEAAQKAGTNSIKIISNQNMFPFISVLLK